MQSGRLLEKIAFIQFMFFVVFLCVLGKELIPKEACDKISGVEVRYNEFYELYLGHAKDSDEIQTAGIVYKSLRGAVNACCPGMELNFRQVNQSIEHLVQEDLLHHHKVQNSSKLVFYFPEFTSQGNLEVYSHKIPFLKLRKSPGFALIMMKSDSHLDLTAMDVIRPSWPIFALVLSLSLAVGIVGWALDHHFNEKEFPKPFVRGMFEGFWWALVTMSTVGYGDKAPKSFLARVLSVLWILAGAILLSLFTANTTSIITASRIEKNSQTLGKKIGVVNMKLFVEAELNLGAQLIEYNKVEQALEALESKTIDRLLFPHYLDLLYLMSDPPADSSELSEIYIAKELDKSYQIGMVLSHSEASSIRNDDFYTCLEIMTSRLSAVHQYNYSRIDSSMVDHSKNAFDTEVAKRYVYIILGAIGLMMIIGIAFDVYSYWTRPDKKETKNPESYMMEERARPM